MQTLQIIADRNQARIVGNSIIEQTLAKKVRAFVHHDKTQWFSCLLEDGDWAQIMQLHQKCPRARIALRDNVSNPSGSECRASTLADYSESIQWAVRPTDSCQHERKFIDTHVDCNLISLRELMFAIEQLKIASSQVQLTCHLNFGKPFLHVVKMHAPGF